jgi:hypothetical protein
MVEFVRAVNEFFSPADTRDDGGKETRVKSMYYLSLLNPMNVIPLRMLSRLYMISAAFWEEVVVPIYASSFLTVRLDAVPSVILPMVSDIIPLAGIPSLTSWQQNSGCVFDEMKSKGNFKRFGGHVVSRVFKAASDDALSVSSASSSPSLSSRPGTSPAKWAVVTSKGTFKGYDLVVFATNSHHAAATRVNSRETKNKEHGSGKTVFGRLLHSIQECWDCIRSAWSGEMPLLDALILNGIEYTDERDDTFVEGVIHSDPSVLPPQHREEMMQR